MAALRRAGGPKATMGSVRVASALRSSPISCSGCSGVRTAISATRLPVAPISCFARFSSDVPVTVKRSFSNE
jgi:hypothetical protein